MIRVMIVDDHLIVREGLRLILETAEMIEVVGEAVDGADCLLLVPEVRPEVILMDLQMPRMDGITAIGQLRRDHPEIAIVILTTYNFSFR
jgi:NarL family two-component system response regulator YdfI